MRSNQEEHVYLSRVVIVEDDFDINHLMEINLTSSRCEVVGRFSTVDQALAFPDWNLVSHVVLDWNLPGKKNGGVLLEWVKNNFPHIKVIVISAYWMNEESTSSGNVIPKDILDRADVFLAKPFSVEELRDVIP